MLDSKTCVLKDIDKGLFDFPASRKGERVYLRWKAGEEEISYWHELEEGLSGRKQIGYKHVEKDNRFICIIV